MKKYEKELFDELFEILKQEAIKKNIFITNIGDYTQGSIEISIVIEIESEEIKDKIVNDSTKIMMIKANNYETDRD